MSHDIMGIYMTIISTHPVLCLYVYKPLKHVAGLIAGQLLVLLFCPYPVNFFLLVACKLRSTCRVMVSVGRMMA